LDTVYVRIVSAAAADDDDEHDNAVSFFQMMQATAYICRVMM